jgi:DNA-binding NtrC family response regulator
MSGAPASHTVLVVEDNPGDARLVRAALAEAPGRRWTVELVERLSDALARLDRGGIDVVLLDVSLPDSHGVATVEAACAHAGSAPVVVFTGFGDETKGTEALRRGAEDYVVKGRLGTGPALSQILAHAMERRRSRRALADVGQALNDALSELGSALSRLPAHDPARAPVERALLAARKATELLGKA